MVQAFFARALRAAGFRAAGLRAADFFALVAGAFFAREDAPRTVVLRPRFAVARLAVVRLPARFVARFMVSFRVPFFAAAFRAPLRTVFFAEARFMVLLRAVFLADARFIVLLRAPFFTMDFAVVRFFVAVRLRVVDLRATLLRPAFLVDFFAMGGMVSSPELR